LKQKEHAQHAGNIKELFSYVYIKIMDKREKQNKTCTPCRQRPNREEKSGRDEA